MITHERFNELYIEASAIFDAKVEQVPLLEVLELADSEYNCLVEIPSNNLDIVSRVIWAVLTVNCSFA